MALAIIAATMLVSTVIVGALDITLAIVLAFGVFLVAGLASCTSN